MSNFKNTCTRKGLDGYNDAAKGAMESCYTSKVIPKGTRTKWTKCFSPYRFFVFSHIFQHLPSQRGRLFSGICNPGSTTAKTQKLDEKGKAYSFNRRHQGAAPQEKLAVPRGMSAGHSRASLSTVHTGS
jgi:hypothetical protein